MTTATRPSRSDTKKPITAHDDIGDSDDRCTQNVVTITGAAARAPIMAILDPTVVYAAPATSTSDDEGDSRSKATEPGPR